MNDENLNLIHMILDINSVYIIFNLFIIRMNSLYLFDYILYIYINITCPVGILLRKLVCDCLKVCMFTQVN